MLIITAKKCSNRRIDVYECVVYNIFEMMNMKNESGDLNEHKKTAAVFKALGKHLASDKYEFYSCGTETKPEINPDAVRLMKMIYGIDMEKTQYSKLYADIPVPDIAISMGCDVGCPYIGMDFDDNWGLADPTGKSDKEFIRVMKDIENRISEL